MNNLLLISSIIGVILLLYSFTRKIGNYVDVWNIINKHLSFFKNNKLQFISIYIIPIVFSLYIGNIQTITRDILDTLVIILSILISMFFAVLSILCSIESKNKSKEYNQLLDETFTSTVFEIIICITLLLSSFVAIFIGKGINEIINTIASDIIYYLTFILILNIFVIIKRIEIVFKFRN